MSGGALDRIQPIADVVNPEPIPSGTIAIPTGFRIPRTIHRASMMLPAGGAFTSEPPESQAFFAIPNGTTGFTFYAVYTRGAAGGRPIFRLEYGNGVEEARSIVIDDASLAIGGADGEFDFYMSEPRGPGPIDANPITYFFEVTLIGHPTLIRLSAAEFGATGTPGNLLITLDGRG